MKLKLGPKDHNQGGCRVTGAVVVIRLEALMIHTRADLKKYHSGFRCGGPRFALQVHVYKLSLF